MDKTENTPGARDLFCDTGALWLSLTPQQQLRLGALALAQELGILGSQTGEDGRATRLTTAFERTAEEAQVEFTRLVQEFFPAFTSESKIVRPDLNAIGIRQCINCGCTDRHACHPPCSWAAPMLCTTCQDSVL